MERHFEEELKRLRNLILKMGFMVDAALSKALEALLEGKNVLAEEVMEDEKAVNDLEMLIDDQGHSMTALMQPLASDLRLVSMILKMNTDLERIGDHAVNIAERAITLHAGNRRTDFFQIPELAKAAQKMLSDAMDAFSKEDLELARSVLKRDDVVDALNDKLYEEVGQHMQKDPAFVKAGMSLVMIGHNLERIADLANNLAEDIFYLKQGREVRHHSQPQSV